jgi:hypothetical protein
MFLFFLEIVRVQSFNCRQRPGIADGGIFEIRPPELLPSFLIKINGKN